jgi:hypothetical protein
MIVELRAEELVWWYSKESFRVVSRRLDESRREW